MDHHQANIYKKYWPDDGPLRPKLVTNKYYTIVSDCIVHFINVH